MLSMENEHNHNDQKRGGVELWQSKPPVVRSGRWFHSCWKRFSFISGFAFQCSNIQELKSILVTFVIQQQPEFESNSFFRSPSITSSLSGYQPSPRSGNLPFINEFRYKCCIFFIILEGWTLGWVWEDQNSIWPLAKASEGLRKGEVDDCFDWKKCKKKKKRQHWWPGQAEDGEGELYRQRDQLSGNPGGQVPQLLS